MKGAPPENDSINKFLSFQKIMRLGSSPEGCLRQEFSWALEPSGPGIELLATLLKGLHVSQFG